MWAGNFGSQKSDNTPHKFNVAGKQIELYFSPSDQTTSQINKVIQSVDYSFEFGSQCLVFSTKFFKGGKSPEFLMGRYLIK